MLTTFTMLCRHKKLAALRFACQTDSSKHWFLSNTGPFVWSFDGERIIFPAIDWYSYCNDECEEDTFCHCSNPAKENDPGTGFALNIANQLWIHAGCEKPTRRYYEAFCKFNG